MQSDQNYNFDPLALIFLIMINNISWIIYAKKDMNIRTISSKQKYIYYITLIFSISG